MWLRQGILIAQTELTRHHRDFRKPLTGRPLLLGAFIVITFLLGWLAHSLGRDLASGNLLSYATLSLLVSVAFAWMVWRSSQYIHARFDQLNPDLLLTTVRPRAAALGLLGFVSTRLILTLIAPTVGLAVGTAIGLQSPTIALTIIIATFSLVALAIAVGTTGRLAARLVALRLVRTRFYRDLLIVFGWIPLFLGVMVLHSKMHRYRLLR